MSEVIDTIRFTINKRFQTRVKRSDRVLEVAEAFGLGLEAREFVIYDNFDVDLQQGDIVYISGQSGSGKSLLLRDLASQYASMSGLNSVADIDDVSYDERPIINQVGQSTDEAIKILNMAGLNDAYLFIRCPSELSDGQLYRFKMALLLNSDADMWVADEFGAVLDRITAKVVAFNVQKFARQNNKTLIVATTHKDMIQELAPTIYIEKRFRNKIEVDRSHGQ